MKKRFGMAMALALGLVLLTAGMAGAAKYQDLAGTWSGGGGEAYWEAPPPPDNYGITGGELNMEVTKQEGALFYGTWGSRPLTGRIATNNVITACVYFDSGRYMVIDAKLTGKKIRGSYNLFTPTSIRTGEFEVIRQP